MLTDTRAITVTGGGGSLFIGGTGRECSVPNSSAITLTLSWIVTGGTGQFIGVSGYGTATGTGSRAIAVHYDGLLSFSGSGIHSYAGHGNYK